MDQWYKEARDCLQQYRFYHSIISQPFNTSLGVAKSERVQRMELFCQQVTGAIDAITNQQQADLLRYEFIVPGGGRNKAEAELKLKQSQYCAIRKAAVKEWWRLVNQPC